MLKRILVTIELTEYCAQIEVSIGKSFGLIKFELQLQSLY
jgi:hypothetical protein